MDSLGQLLSHKKPVAGSPPPVSEETFLHSEAEEKTPHVQKETQNELRSLIINMKKDLDQMLRVLDGVSLSPAREETFSEETREEEPAREQEQVIEGVFNGLRMIGDGGTTYDVPANYASKSKLVEGDMMKLTIGKQGNFIYKQIGPIERQRIRGTLFYNDTDAQWSIITAVGKSYKILTASVTFFKGKAGNEVVGLVPKNAESEWAAVEHIIS